MIPIFFSMTALCGNETILANLLRSQRGDSGPRSGGNLLSVALTAGRAGGGRPTAVGILLAQEERAGALPKFRNSLGLRERKKREGSIKVFGGRKRIWTPAPSRQLMPGKVGGGGPLLFRIAHFRRKQEQGSGGRDIVEGGV